MECEASLTVEGYNKSFILYFFEDGRPSQLGVTIVKDLQLLLQNKSKQQIQEMMKKMELIELDYMQKESDKERLLQTGIFETDFYKILERGYIVNIYYPNHRWFYKINLEKETFSFFSEDWDRRFDYVYSFKDLERALFEMIH